MLAVVPLQPDVSIGLIAFLGCGVWLGDDGPAVVGPVQVDAAAGGDVGEEMAQVGVGELGELGGELGASSAIG